jgi:hypothetical protein
MPSCCEVRPSVLQERSQALSQTVMGSSEAPLDRRIEDINTKIKSCDKFLTQTLKADSEEPTCDSIVAAIFNRTATDATEYDGLTKKLEDMELSEVSVFKRR